jgi:hypothetical protein
MKEYSDSELLNAWERYSDMFYAAGFISPTEGEARQFVRWLLAKPTALNERVPEEGYEFLMLDVVRKVLDEMDV